MTIPICYKNEEMPLDCENIWEGDLFQRQELAQNYTKIITSIVQPYVLSINAKYGSGKTFFLKRWSEELKQNGEIVIFFNSWDCDFVDKPLLPFLYNFLEQLKAQGLVKYDLVEDLHNCKDIFCKGLNQILEASSGLDVEILRTYTNADNLKLPKIQTLEEYNELRIALTNFKSGLSDIVSKLEGKNIYIFVDELERCRPTFAVELLEAIKHLFNVKGLVFILGIDRSQLKHTISNIYGCRMDGEGYLRRFIDLELELTEPNLKDFSNALKNKFQIQNNLDGAFNNWVIGYSEFHRYFDIFSSIYDFQLRDVEQLYAKFSVITKMIDERIIKITPILALLMMLKLKDQDLYNEFTLDKLVYPKASEFLENNIFSKIKNRNPSNEKYLQHFTNMCMALQPIAYDDLSYETEKIEEKRLYNELSKMQIHTYPYDQDRIKYLKNMISCVYIEK